MNLEKLITDTFTAHEPDAPDSERVLAAARRRIDRRRTVSRPLAVAAGVVALTVAGVTVIGLNRAEDAPGGGDVAAPATAPADPAVDGLSMPFTLGWLPPGEVKNLVHRLKPGGSLEAPVYGGEYMLEVTTGERVLSLTVSETTHTSVEEAASSIRSGPGRPVTIGGEPAVESSVFGVPEGYQGYEVYATHPDGGTTWVHVSAKFGSTATEEQLTGIGRRIAENLRYPGDTVITPTFGIGELPDGLAMCAFDVEYPSDLRSETDTLYELGTCDALPTIGVGTGSTNEPPGTPGRPVLGHQTRHADEDGSAELWVLDAVGDRAIRIAGVGAPAPLEKLYGVAESLRLPD